MKEPFLAVAGTAALLAGTGAVSDPALADRVGAVLAAGVTSSLYSWWKGRKRKSPSVDIGIWALITLFGSMSLGWFLGPVLANREMLGIATPDVPPMTWLLAMSGTPIVEWLLAGRGFAAVMERAGLIKPADDA